MNSFENEIKMESLNMAQNESIVEEEKSNQVELPWIGFLSRPQMNFRRPKFPLPHKAPHQYVIAILFFFSLFLLAGGIYDLAEQPISLGFTEKGYTPIYPSLNDQFFVESIATMVFIGIGAAGFFLLKYPTEEGMASDVRSVSFIQGIGMVLIFIGLFATYVMLQMKLYGSF
jgi:hypothetical protein